MTSTDDRPPTVEEAYLTANHTSNLRVVADKRGAADVIIAAGWSDSRVGMALIRLAGEWDGAEKRPRMSETDLILLRCKLKSLTAVMAQVAWHMARRGMEDPEGRAGAIVGHWLDQTCHGCHGLRFVAIRDTPALSAMRCRYCHGSGQSNPPPGSRDVLSWMDDAVTKGRASMSRRLRNT